MYLLIYRPSSSIIIVIIENSEFFVGKMHIINYMKSLFGMMSYILYIYYRVTLISECMLFLNLLHISFIYSLDI